MHIVGLRTGHCQSFHQKFNLNTCSYRLTNVRTKIITFRYIQKIIPKVFLTFPGSYISVIPNLNETPAEQVDHKAHLKLSSIHLAENCFGNKLAFLTSRNCNFTDYYFYYIHFEINGVSCNLIG